MGRRVGTLKNTARVSVTKKFYDQQRNQRFFGETVFSRGFGAALMWVVVDLVL